MKAFYTKGGVRQIGICGCWMWYPVYADRWTVCHDTGDLQSQFFDSEMFAVVNDFGDLVRVPA